jgi:hypothetical protein
MESACAGRASESDAIVKADVASRNFDLNTYMDIKTPLIFF